MPQPTVLYVEDEEFDAMFMHKAFEKVGLAGSLKVVPDGQQAIDYLAGSGPYADRREHPLPAIILGSSAKCVPETPRIGLADL
jgi:CheY-like chemotaxis protein